jgi:hypothetical protein
LVHLTKLKEFSHVAFSRDFTIISLEITIVQAH